MKDLLWMNKQPNFDYLKIPEKKSSVGPIRRPKDQDENGGKGGVYYQKRINPDEVRNPDHEAHFSKIVSRAKSRMMDSGETAPRILHHHSN